MQSYGRKSTKKYSYAVRRTWRIKRYIHGQIKKIGKSYRSFRSVPCELTSQKAERRVAIWRQLIIGNPIDNRFIRRLVTCDKTGSITAILTLRNSGSVPVNLLTSSLKRRFGKECCVSGGILKINSLGVCSKQVCSRCGSLFSTTGTSSWNFQTEICSIS